MPDRINIRRICVQTLGMLLGFGLACTAGAVGQTTWYVDNDAPNDPGPNTPDTSDPNEDGSPEHPFDAIQEGIDAATDGDTVLVLNGTYGGVGAGNCNGNCNIDFDGKAITVRSESGPENCVIIWTVGGEQLESRGFHFYNNETSDSVVDGFKIFQGYVGDSANGGGILIEDASPTIMNCIIAECFARNGGGIFCSGGSPVFTNCEVVNNHSITGGVGVYTSGGSPTFIGCIIADNVVDGQWERGAGLLCRGGTILLEDSIISGHRDGGFNGGLGCGGIDARESVQLTIRNCQITNNHRDEGIGGGIYCSGYLEITDSTIANNWGYDGGGIKMDSGIIEGCIIEQNGTVDGLGSGGGINAGHDLIVNACTIRDNWAGRGGGIRTRAGNLTVTGSILTRNTTAYHPNGGAISYWEGSCTINACTITDHDAGAVYSSGGGDAAVTNSIFWGNQPVSTSGNVLITYCDVQGGWPGTGNIDSDPLFVDPDADDFHLSPGSPCINAGTNYDPNLPTLDIDGEARLQNCRVDMGADESPHLPPLADCNGNDTEDDCDIFNGVSADDNEDHIPDECDIPTEDPNDAVPDDDGDPNTPDAPDDGDGSPEDPNNSSQSQPEDEDASLPCCGPDACGPGVLGWMPLSILAMGSIKTRRIFKR